MIAGTNIRRIRVTMLLLAAATLITMGSAAASAALIINKSIHSNEVEAGDNLTISLTIQNNRQREMLVNIQDENVIGSAGLIIDCLEKQIPAQETIEIAYPSFTVYSVGDFQTGKAQVYYRDPDTNQTIKSVSNSLNVEVAPSQNHTFGTRESLTRMYDCQGIKSVSKSYSASITSTHFKERSGLEGGQMLFSRQSNFDEPPSENMDNPLEKILYQDSEFMDRHNEIVSQGFSLVSKQIKNIDDSTGKFAYEYLKENKSIVLTGIIDQKQIESVHVLDNVSWAKRYGLLILITLLIFFIVWFFTRTSEFDKSLLKRRKKSKR